MSPVQREPDGTRRIGPTWESLVERQIREAMESGAFEALPHQGEPLPLEDDAAAGEWALAYRMLRDAGAAPPWIEADKDARERIAAVEDCVARARRGTVRGRARSRDEATRLVAAANEAIVRLNSEAPTDRQHRALLDLEVVLRRMDESPPEG